MVKCTDEKKRSRDLCVAHSLAKCKMNVKQRMKRCCAGRFSFSLSLSLARRPSDQNKDTVAPHHKHIRYIWRNQYAVFLVCIRCVFCCSVMFPLTFRFVCRCTHRALGYLFLRIDRAGPNRQSNYAPTSLLSIRFRNPQCSEMLLIKEKKRPELRVANYTIISHSISRLSRNNGAYRIAIQFAVNR